MNQLKKGFFLLMIAGTLCQTPRTVFAQNLPQSESDTQLPEEEMSGDATATPDSEQDTSDIDLPAPSKDTEISTELPTPKPVKKIKTTKKSSSSVLLEWNESNNATKYEVYRKTDGENYQLLKVTKKNSYVDKKIHQNTKYVYKILAVNAHEKKSQPARVKFNNIAAVQIKSQKYTYAQMKKDLSELKSMYNNYCEMTKIGTSVKGRGIYDFAIGNPDAKKSLLVVSTLHAREYICSAEMMLELEYYLENYNRSIGGVTPSKALDNIQIHYIVMANPDGVTISQTKNSTWKSNGRGVDLNYNFPTKKFVVGGKRGSQRYTGSKALSEPESLAISKLTKKLIAKQNLQGVINYHAMGRIIFGDCKLNSIKKDTRNMYRIAKKYTGYADAAGYHSKSWGGQYREYVMYELKIPSITIEIGTTSAPCSFWQYETEFRKNKQVVLQIAKYFR